MEFYDFTSMYDCIGKQTKLSPDEFYTGFANSVIADAMLARQQGRDINPFVVTINQNVAEQLWYQLGKPYYKVYPGVLPFFICTKLDVPGEYFRLPIPSMLIRLPQNHEIPELKVDDTHEIKTILVTEYNPKSAIELEKPKTNFNRRITMWIDFGEKIETLDVPVLTYQNINFLTDDSIELALTRQQAPEKQEPNIGIPVPLECVTACARIVVSVCFLATNADRIVEADVLTKHLERYLRSSDPKEREYLHLKAKRRNKYGWTVGREITIPRLVHADKTATGEPTGRHLKYKHIRSAHFHIVRYGPGKQNAKVKFYYSVTVRPDLPAAPQSRRGYKTVDTPPGDLRRGKPRRFPSV